jgi:hypothetical protein
VCQARQISQPPQQLLRTVLEALVIPPLLAHHCQTVTQKKATQMINLVSVRTRVPLPMCFLYSI